MRIPGFTAEAAVHQTVYRYEMAGVPDFTPGKAAVAPQACVNIGPCQVCVTFRIFPPKACLTFKCLGFNRSFCVP